MARIDITDTAGVNIVSANPQLNTGLGKYLKKNAGAVAAGVDAVSQLRMPVHLANPGEAGPELTWAGDVPLGDGGPALMVSAGATAHVGVFNRTGMVVVGRTFLGPAITVRPGKAFVSFSFEPTLVVGLKQQAGVLSFGFSAGTSAEFSCYRPVNLQDPMPTLASVVKDVIEGFVIPGSADDLKRMRDVPEDTIASASGHGQLKVAAEVNLVAAFNPLAAVDTLPRLGTLQAKGGASATVGITATLSGGFQIRARKMPGAVVRLSVHTLAGRGIDISVGAGASAGLTLGTRDLLAMLSEAPDDISEPMKIDLTDGGISKAQLERVATAMKAGMSRKLEVAVRAQFSQQKQDEAAFEYDVHLDELDETGADAIDLALTGDLTAMNALESQMPSHGLTMLKSGTVALREKKVSWRINLLGLVNIMSVRDLIRTGTVVQDPDSGELVIADKISSDRVGAITDPKNLRRLLYESTLVTLTYKAGGLAQSGMTAGQTFFVFEKDANRQRVSDYLDGVVALGLMLPTEVNSQLGAGDDFGKASLSLETTFDQKACERLFGLADVPANDVPPTDVEYEAIGRRALLALVKPTDPDAFRRIPIEDDAVWAAMKRAGQASLDVVLPPLATGSDDTRKGVRVAVIRSDFTVIRWWAIAMATAAQQLVAMRKVLAGRTPGDDLRDDAEFQAARHRLEAAVADAVRKNTASFGDPWGLVALFMASAGRATAQASIVSQALTLFRPE